MGFEPVWQKQTGPKPSSMPVLGRISARASATATHAPSPIVDQGARSVVQPRVTHNFGQMPIQSAPRGMIQPKLTINTPGDAYEQEADRIADRVAELGAGTPAAGRPNPPPATPTPVAQRRVMDTPGPSAGLGLEGLPASSSGQPLEMSTRQFFESRLGHDFGQVRVHTDPIAAQSARAINARAYTAGRDIYFGAAQFNPGSDAGTRLMAHELVHVVQQNGADAASAALVQRSPDEPTGGAGQGAPASPYPEENDAIRYAVGARELGKLGAGAALYQTKYWKVVGLAADAFYAGPFTSDMGNIYYVYHITGADENTSSYSLARATTVLGWTDHDVAAKLATVQGGQALQFKGAGLIAPPGGAVAQEPKKQPAQGGAPQPAGSGDAGKTQDDDPEVLTPQRKKWLKAGRQNMKNEINPMFNQLQKLKEARLVTWEKNANIKDPKPIKDALSVAVEVVGYGLGGVVGGLLTKAMAHGLAQEFAKEFLLKSTVKLAEYIFDHAVEPAEEFLAAATKKALDEGREGNTTNALATQTNLLDCYVESTRLQTLSEERAQTDLFNSTSDARYPTDLALADLVLVMQKLLDELSSAPHAFLRELSIGLLRLQNEVYVDERAEKKYGGSVERLMKEDPDIHETTERPGNLVLLGPSPDIGKWYSPDLNFDGFGAIATGVNNATLGELRGTPIKDLPLTLEFRFWGINPFSGFFQEVFCKVWFERRPNGDIWVDFDQSTPGMNVDTGIEWLASYGSGKSQELTDEERRKYAPIGARKVYEHVKDKPVKNLSNSDIF
jgi:hypothetical protein